jgi:hypothetical protein
MLICYNIISSKTIEVDESSFYIEIYPWVYTTTTRSVPYSELFISEKFIGYAAGHGGIYPRVYLYGDIFIYLPHTYFISPQV